MGGVAQTYGEHPHIRDAWALGSDVSEDAARGHVLVRHASEEDRADFSTGAASDVYNFLGVVDQVYGAEAAGSATEETVDTLDARVAAVKWGRNIPVKIQDSATVAYLDPLTFSTTGEGALRTALAGEPVVAICKKAITSGAVDQTTLADILPPNAIGAAAQAAGTASAGVTAFEEVNGPFHKTTLTVSTTLPAITGGVDQALGKSLYTLPAGVKQILGSYFSLDLDESDGNVTADTPDAGLGTTIASGAVAVLGGTAAFENIMTGEAFPDMNGTADLRNVATNLSIAAADSHEIFFNLADGFAAGGEAACALAGTVVILWADLT